MTIVVNEERGRSERADLTWMMARSGGGGEVWEPRVRRPSGEKGQA